MSQSSTPSDTRYFVEGWQSPTAAGTGCHIWRTVSSHGECYVGEVYQNGQTVRVLSGPTREAIVEKLSEMFPGFGERQEMSDHDYAQ
jgi:hypothetical protein